MSVSEVSPASYCAKPRLAVTAGAEPERLLAISTLRRSASRLAFWRSVLGARATKSSPPAAQTVRSAEHALSGPYNLTQDVVPAVVSVGVVHALEVVQVEEDDGERSLIALRFVRLLLQLGV